jgi:O-methyltransferase
MPSKIFYPINQITYKRSLPVRIAKVVLAAANRGLPKGMYTILYGSGRYLLWSVQRVLSKARLFAAVFVHNENVGKLRLVDKLLPFTMGGPLALSATFDVVTMAERDAIRGALVECGVGKGGCGAMMALVSKELGSKRTLWLCDSYEGLPEPTEKDFRAGKTGEMIGPLSQGMLLHPTEQVSDLIFNKCRLLKEDVKIVKGWFQDTLPAVRKDIGEIAVLRLDGDWYESTKCCLENLYDIVSPTGFVIIDDYATCYGAERAVTEFMLTRRIEVELIPDGRGGVWFRKPGQCVNA